MEFVISISVQFANINFCICASVRLSPCFTPSPFICIRNIKFENALFWYNKYLHKENTNEIIIGREKPLQALYKANNKCTSKVDTRTSQREIVVEPMHTTNELSTQPDKTYRERNKAAEAPRLDASVYNTIGEFIVDTERRQFI